MQIDEQDARLHHFAEEMGLFFEQSGGSRMAGRIIGWLHVCDPPRQNAGQLAEALHASAGSISTHTRMLLQMNLVEKVAVRGDRRAWYQLSDGAWERTLRGKVVSFTLMRELAERGLELLGDRPPEARARLEELHDLYVFFEREFPLLLDKFHAEREARRVSQGSAS